MGELWVAGVGEADLEIVAISADRSELNGGNIPSPALREREGPAQREGEGRSQAGWRLRASPSSGSLALTTFSRSAGEGNHSRPSMIGAVSRM